MSQYAAEGKLDESYCPYIKGKPRASTNPAASLSTATGNYKYTFILLYLLLYSQVVLLGKFLH